MSNYIYSHHILKIIQFKLKDLDSFAYNTVARLLCDLEQQITLESSNNHQLKSALNEAFLNFGKSKDTLNKYK